MGCCHRHRCGPPCSWDYEYQEDVEFYPPRRRRRSDDDLREHLDQLEREIESVRRRLDESGKPARGAG